MSIFHMVEDVLLSLFQSAGDRPRTRKGGCGELLWRQALAISTPLQRSSSRRELFRMSTTFLDTYVLVNDCSALAYTDRGT